MHTIIQTFFRYIKAVIKPFYAVAFISVIVVLPANATSLVGFKAYPELGVSESELKEVLNFTVNQKGMSKEEIARTLTLFYRDKGLSFHQVIIKSGNLVLIEGVLSSISIQDPQWNAIINNAISDLKGKVVYEPRIRSTLLKLNRWPGIELFSFYSVADSYGGVNLNVIVKKAKIADVSTSIDNHGLALSGQHRLLLNASVYNLLVKPTKLTFGGHVSDALGNYSFSTNLTQYKSLDQLWRFNLSAQRLSLDDSTQNLGLVGSNFSAKYSAQWNLQPTALKSNSKQLWVRFSQSSLKQSDLESGIYISNLNKSSSYFQFGAGYSTSGLSSNNKNQFNLDSLWILGWTALQENTDPSNAVTAKGKVSLTLRRDILSGLYNNQDLQLGLSGQIGTPNMHSSERFALTGQSGLTQWEPSKASTEQAVLVNAKLFLLQGNLDALTYNLFVNTQAGLGYSKPSETSEFMIQLAGLSVQSNLSYKDFSVKASYEQPLYASQESWDDSGKVLFKVGYEKQF